MDKTTIAATLLGGFVSGGGLVAFLTRAKTDAEKNQTIAETYSKLLGDVKEELLEKIERMDRDHKQEIEKFKQIIIDKDTIISNQATKLEVQATQIADLQTRVGTIETQTT